MEAGELDLVKCTSKIKHVIREENVHTTNTDKT